MRYQLILFILFLLTLASAKSITSNSIQLSADDLHYCDIASEDSDGYAKCHNYIKLQRSGVGSSIINNAQLFPTFVSSDKIRNLTVYQVVATYYNETEYNVSCYINKLTNTSVCYTLPYLVTKIRYSSPTPFSNTLTLDSREKWYDIYWEMPNFQQKTWNLTFSGLSVGSFSIVLDPNTTSACGNIVSPNQVYLLNQSVTSASSCFSILANNITLDCYGYSILGSRVSASTGITMSNRRNVTIKNCRIANFSTGIYSSNSDRLTIDNVDVSDQYDLAVATISAYGLRLESTTNILASRITANRIYAYSLVLAGNGFGAYIYNTTNSSLSNFITRDINSISGAFVGYQYGLYLNGVNSSNITHTFDNNYGHFNMINTSKVIFKNNSFSHDPQNPRQGFYFTVQRSDDAVFDGGGTSNLNVSNEIIYFSDSRNVVFKDYQFRYKDTWSTSNSYLIRLQNVNNSYFSNNIFYNFTHYHWNYINTLRNAVFSNNTFIGSYGTDSQILFGYAGSNLNLTYEDNLIANLSLANFKVHVANYETRNVSFIRNRYLNLRKGLYDLSGTSYSIDEVYENSSNSNIANIASIENTNFTFINFSNPVAGNLSYYQYGQVVIKYYARANVTDQDRIPLSNALVNVTNSTSSFAEFRNLVTTNGLTDFVLVTQFAGNSSSNTSFTPHTFNALKSSTYGTWLTNSTAYSINFTQTIPLILQFQSTGTSLIIYKKVSNEFFLNPFLRGYLFNNILG